MGRYPTSCVLEYLILETFKCSVIVEKVYILNFRKYYFIRKKVLDE